MNLKSLLMSEDEKTVRILRRVLGDLEIDVEHCGNVTEAIRHITRQRFEAIIVDVSNIEEASSVLRGAKAAPVNKRALGIVLVEASLGLKGGFEMGAHFVLHKPFAVERAKASFRAVRALMRRERRLQLRVPVQFPIECYGSSRYKAKTIDVCEGGMAIQFSGRVPKENVLRFSFELPGTKQALEIYGELAWEGADEQAGVRFKDPSDEQRKNLQEWVSRQLSEPEPEDPPISCRLSKLSHGGCYLTTSSPFPRGTRVLLSIKAAGAETRAGGMVLVAHPEFGMGVEFLRNTAEQREQTERMIKALSAGGDPAIEVQVVPEGLETLQAPGIQAAANVASGSDLLVDLFRHKFQVPVESFMKQMQAQGK